MLVLSMTLYWNVEHRSLLKLRRGREDTGTTRRLLGASVLLRNTEPVEVHWKQVLTSQFL